MNHVISKHITFGSLRLQIGDHKNAFGFVNDKLNKKFRSTVNPNLVTPVHYHYTLSLFMFAAMFDLI